MPPLTLQSKLKLRDGNEIPLLGFGSYELDGEEAYQSVTWALEAGYRHIASFKSSGGNDPADLVSDRILRLGTKMNMNVAKPSLISAKKLRHRVQIYSTPRNLRGTMATRVSKRLFNVPWTNVV